MKDLSTASIKSIMLKYGPKVIMEGILALQPYLVTWSYSIGWVPPCEAAVQSTEGRFI